MPAGLQAGTTSPGAALSTLHISLCFEVSLGKILMPAGLQAGTIAPKANPFSPRIPLKNRVYRLVGFFRVPLDNNAFRAAQQ